nr:MAG TPA: hypothetical protein [Caudoviricetes sp.]
MKRRRPRSYRGWGRRLLCGADRGYSFLSVNEC